MMGLVLAATGLAAAAQDQPAPPANLDPDARADAGAVARLMAAQDLFALARAHSDPLAALCAARIMADLALSPVTRRSDATDIPAFSPPPSKAMFDLAKALTLDENLAALIEDERARAQSPHAPVTVEISPGLAAPGGTDRWDLAFYAGALAEIAVVGGGDGVLDIRITDSAGHVICRQSGPRDRLYCPFVPRENGRFTVEVSNPGPSPLAYGMMTN